MIRVGLIGAGFIGRNHFNQYAQLAGRARVAAICDRDAARRTGDWSQVGGNLADATGRAQDISGIRTFENWKDVVRDDEIDMVDIALPTPLHAEVTIAALKAGKHVLCEKPMALTVRECDRMIAAAEKSGRRFMIAQCVRFWPQYVWLKQACAERRYGELTALSLRRQAGMPTYSYQHWILDAAQSGGAILDLHVHDVDYALYLLGKPKSIMSQGCYRDNSLDRVQSFWQYDRPVTVFLEAFWDMPPGFGFNMGFTALFEKGGVTWDSASGVPLTVITDRGTTETPTMTPSELDAAYYAEIEHFVTCIETGRTPSVSTPQESRDAVAIAHAERKSIETGRRVAIQ